MDKAYFIFTKYTRSFSVRIPNLDKLSVKQIQEIQNFVKTRNGFFDFDSYTFSIQKKIEFKEFCRLIEQTHMHAHVVENIREIRSQPRVGFGQYKGMQYNELPDSYMLWLRMNYRGYERDIIDKELKKRKL